MASNSDPEGDKDLAKMLYESLVGTRERRGVLFAIEDLCVVVAKLTTTVDRHESRLFSEDGLGVQIKSISDSVERERKERTLQHARNTNRINVLIGSLVVILPSIAWLVWRSVQILMQGHV